MRNDDDAKYPVAADVYLAPYGVTLEELAPWVADRLSRSETLRLNTQDNPICLTWWLHPEVVERFAALHQEWKAAVETKSISSWWVYHWGPQTEKIFGGKEKAPMSGCNRYSHWLEHLSMDPVPVPNDVELGKVVIVPPSDDPQAEMVWHPLKA